MLKLMTVTAISLALGAVQIKNEPVQSPAPASVEHVEPATVEHVKPASVERVEPLSWWVGMKTELQLLVKGSGIGAFQASVEGTPGVYVKAVHKADSPNYLFLDVHIDSSAKAGTYTLVFKNGTQTIRQPYKLEERQARTEKSFGPEDLIYLIMPDRFADGDPSIDSTAFTKEGVNRKRPNSRHGGDLKGIMKHLDYIENLGATAIWCTPLLLDNDAKGSYHGYACADYYRIDPRYGSNELYRQFVEKAHKKGLKVIMDVVTNHSSLEHWWMKDLPFKDWVHLNDPYMNSNHQMSLAMDPNASKADKAVMEEGWFVPSMPDMNLDNPFLLKYFQQWAVWWVEYSGLDGYRVDTWYYNEKIPMSAWAKAVTDEYPWLNIVGENWNTNPDYVAYWQKDHPNKDGFNSFLPSIMDFPLQAAITEAFQVQRKEPRWQKKADIAAVYNALSHDFQYTDLSHMLIFLSNHDCARIGDTFGRDPRRMKMAFTLLATLRGIPQLFYGDEMMFSTGNPQREDGRLRLDFPGGWEGDSVNLFTEKGRKAAMKDSTYSHAKELHDFARTLFRWRKDKEVIHSGKTLHFIPENNTYGYFRYNDGDVVFVFINNSEEPCNVPWTRFKEISEGLGKGRNVITGESMEISDKTAVGPMSSLVVEFKR